MLTPFVLASLLLGLVVGLLLALVHAWASQRAVLALLRDGSRRALVLGFPLRVILPALGIGALALISNGAVVAGALAFVVGQRLALRRSPS